jgi:hypothetical protein
MATARELYAAARRNQAAIRAVDTLVKRDTATLLNTAAGLGQQQMGGFLRQLVPGIVDRYGQVNATAAMRYYDERRLLSLGSRPGASLPGRANRQLRQNARRQASNRAAAELRSQVFLAQRAPINPVAVAQSPINYAMKIYQESGFGAMQDGLSNAMTRAVAGYNRDTILYNSALDPEVVGVQRVAEPGACGFCSLQAVASIDASRGFRSEPAYAVEFHNNCRCSIETLYADDEFIIPEHYQQFEQEYEEASLTREPGQSVLERFNQIARDREVA